MNHRARSNGMEMLRTLQTVQATLAVLEDKDAPDGLIIARRADIGGYVGPSLAKSVCLATSVAAQVQACPLSWSKPRAYRPEVHTPR